MIKLPKRTISITLILVTLVATVYYFSKHQSLLTDLRHIPLWVIASVFGLYCLMLVVLTLIFSATLRIARTKLNFKENILLNAYSLFMNFFIPGQTGPIIRGYYLKKNKGLKVLDYTIVTIIYYLFYGLVSVILLLMGSQAWWVTVLAAAAMIAAGSLGLKIYLAKFKKERLDVSARNLIYLILVTILQAMLQITIYFIELHSINHSIKLTQVVVYTGAANLALYVALTPGAIGIRESFLLLTQRLHHISGADIVLANVIDRSVFIIFLLSIGLVTLLIKTKDKLDLNKLDLKEAE
jgi:uncharacterized membrane protein YbhN (UPF0104 family)